MKVVSLRLCALALLIFALESGAPGDAQPSSGTDSNTIIVNGHRLPAATLEARVSRFVRGRGKYSRIDQITMWRDPVCPLVRNLPAAYGAFISARIEEIARNVGAPTIQQCSPNIEIIFTPQPQTVMDEVAVHSPTLLGFHFAPNTRALATVTKPIQAWYVTATSNGVQTVIDGPLNPQPGGTAGSRLTHGLQSVLMHVLILVNTNEISGRPVGPIADYLAMLSLSQITAQEQGRCVDVASMTNLFSADCPDTLKPQSLTIADMAYLEGIYSMGPSDIGSLQRSAIFSRMVRRMRGGAGA